MLETHVKLCVTAGFFWRKKNGEYSKNGGNGPNTGFFEFIGKFGHIFSEFGLS